jgi:hypothetical protein
LRKLQIKKCTLYARYYLEKNIGIFIVSCYQLFRLLKNRKSARKSRRRRKAELTTLREEVKLLREECERLRKIAAPFLQKQQPQPQYLGPTLSPEDLQQSVVV